MPADRDPLPPSDPDDVAHRRLRSVIERRLFGRTTPVEVGRYRIIEELGRGGMGVVYLAEDPELGREVAVKLMRRGSSARRERLIREARAMAQVSHPNVVPVYDVGETDGQVYVVMQRVRGQTLAQWLEASRPEAEVLAAFIDAGQGLVAAHAAGIVHRDFKPMNVLVDTDGRVQVVDFGIARGSTASEAGESSATSDPLGGSLAEPRLTETGLRLGTPVYMAPEQHTGEAITAAVDQFAFCATLFEALARRPAFSGSTLEQLREAKRARPEAPEIPSWLDAVLQRGLAERPDARFGSMSELVAELQRGARPVRRRRAVWAVGGLALLVAGAVGVQRVQDASALAACDTAGPSPTLGWTTERGDEITERIAEQGPPFAEVTWQRLRERFDGQAGAIADAHRELCRREVQSPEQASTHQAARDCVDIRAAELDAIADVVERDPDVLSRNLAFGYGVQPVQGCLADPTALRGTSSTRIRLDDRRELIRISTLRDTGATDEAERRALELLESADDPATRLQAQIEVGRAQFAQGRADEAEAVMSTAFGEAQARHDESSALLAAGSLVWNGAQLRRFSKTQPWARSLAAILERSPELPAMERAAALRSLAGWQEARGQPLASLDLLREAVELSAQALGAEHPQVASYRGDLATQLVRLNRHEEARPVIEAAVAAEVDAYGEDHPRVAVTRLTLAGALMRAGEHETALRQADQSVAALQAAMGRGHPNVAGALAVRSTILEAAGDPEHAKADLRAAIAILVEARGEAAPRVSGFRGNLAGLLLRSGEIEEAHTLAEQAWDGVRDALGPDHVNTVPACLVVARAGLAKDERSVETADECARVAAMTLPEANRQRIYTVIVQGWARLAADEVEGATQAFQHAYDIAVEMGRARMHADAAFGLARALHRTGSPARGNAMADEARAAYVELDVPDAVADVDAWRSKHATP